MILIVTSPDIVSIGMFSDYVTKNYLHDSIYVNLNGLVSLDVQEALANFAIKEHTDRDIIFKHKTRKRLLPSKIPPLLMEKADCVVGFDLFSTHVEVLKSRVGWTDMVVSSYHDYIEKQNLK